MQTRIDIVNATASDKYFGYNDNFFFVNTVDEKRQ